MDNIDRLIKDTLKQKIDIPLSCENKILYTLQKKKLVKKYKHFKLIKSFCTACLGIIFSTGFVFAGYTVYEKIWKEPQVFNTFEERIEYDREFSEKEAKELLEKNKIISIEEAISNSSDIFKQLEIEQNITTENVKINSETFLGYFEIETNEYEMTLDSSGKFRFFKNKKYNFYAKDNIIDENTALELSNKIINNLNLDKQYSLRFIEHSNGYRNNNGYNIWLACYYETINGLQNEYNSIYISFSIIDNNMVIESISNLDNNFEFKNGEILITKEKAIEIAKTADRKISILDITKTDAELAIKRLNSFVYAQEKTLGKEDEYRYEIINDVTNSYNAYSNEKIIRTVWKVKISYNYNEDNARNDKEFLGRYYYVDATTGEIIGGSWGQFDY